MCDDERRAQDERMGIRGAADYLGVGQGALRRWADKGYVPHMRAPSGYRLFSRFALDEFRDGLLVRRLHGDGRSAGDVPSMIERAERVKALLDQADLTQARWETLMFHLELWHEQDCSKRQEKASKPA